MSSKKAVVAIASGLALTGAEATADIVSQADDPDVFLISSDVEVDIAIFEDEADELLLQPLPDYDDEVATPEHLAQTWYGGTGNDGLVGGSRSPGGRSSRVPEPSATVNRTSPKLNSVSKPASRTRSRNQLKTTTGRKSKFGRKKR